MAAMQQHDGGCVSLSPIQEMEPLMTQHDVAGPVVDIGGMGDILWQPGSSREE